MHFVLKVLATKALKILWATQLFNLSYFYNIIFEYIKYSLYHADYSDKSIHTSFNNIECSSGTNVNKNIFGCQKYNLSTCRPSDHGQCKCVRRDKSHLWIYWIANPSSLRIQPIINSYNNYYSRRLLITI